MSRSNRIIFQGAIYHIYQRGNNKAYIFKNPTHKAFLLKQIKECNQVYDFQLLAYVIMNNHYHLLIKTNKTSISKIMFSINNVLAKYLNREFERTGHIFEGRYGSRLVENEADLIWLLRYIHRNPVRANLCQSADEYKWSSHTYYKYGFNLLIDTSIILNSISRDKNEAINKYRRLIGSDEIINPKMDFKKIKSEFNLEDCKLGNYEKFKNSKQSESIKIEESGSRSIQKPMDEILNSLNLDPQYKWLITSGIKTRNATIYKIKFIQEAIKYKYTYKEIGVFLNISQSAISNIMARNNVIVGCK